MKLLICAVALAHLWYPPECCSRDNDCHPVPCDQIKRDGTDFIFKGMHFNGSMVRQSLDTNCHVCFGIAPYCLFLRPEA